MSKNAKQPPRPAYFEAGGDRYGALLDFNALCDLEEALGCKLASLVRRDEKGDPVLDENKQPIVDVTNSQGRAILWAALNGWVRRDRPQGRSLFTLNAAGDVMGMVIAEGGEGALAACLAKATGASMPDPDEPTDAVGSEAPGN